MIFLKHNCVLLVSYILLFENFKISTYGKCDKILWLMCHEFMANVTEFMANVS